MLFIFNVAAGGIAQAAMKLLRNRDIRRQHQIFGDVPFQRSGSEDIFQRHGVEVGIEAVALGVTGTDTGTEVVSKIAATSKLKSP